MTCIVGFVDKKLKKVFIGGDSAGSANGIVTKRKDVKIFYNSEFLFGCTTSFRMLQLLRYKLQIPEIFTRDIYEYMCTDFVDAVKRCLEENGYTRKHETGEDCGGQFLVGYKDRLFIVDSDYQVGEHFDGYAAVGSGADVALGALYIAGNSNLYGHDAVKIALEASEKFCTTVSKPFVIKNT